MAAAALAVLGLGVTGLALAAPESLVTDVALGAPFVPFAGTSRVLTPIGVVGLGLLLVVAVLTAPRWWAVLRRADLVGALLVAVALGSLVLTFASSDPEKEVVGPLGYSLLPVGALALLVLAWWHRRAADPLIPRGVVGARGLRALVVSLLVGAALVAVVVDVPLLARLTDAYDETGAALVLVRFLLAVPVGALLGGWSLRRLGDGAVAGTGLLLAGGGLLVMSRWTLDSVSATVPATVVLVVVGLGMGLALAPVNNAALADSPADAHGVASSLVVVARMVGMVVGLALLTSIGLSRYFEAVRRLPEPARHRCPHRGRRRPGADGLPRRGGRSPARRGGGVHPRGQRPGDGDGSRRMPTRPVSSRSDRPARRRSPAGPTRRRHLSRMSVECKPLS